MKFWEQIRNNILRITAKTEGFTTEGLGVRDAKILASFA